MLLCVSIHEDANEISIGSGGELESKSTGSGSWGGEKAPKKRESYREGNG